MTRASVHILYMLPTVDITMEAFWQRCITPVSRLNSTVSRSKYPAKTVAFDHSVSSPTQGPEEGPSGDSRVANNAASRLKLSVLRSTF